MIEDSRRCWSWNDAPTGVCRGIFWDANSIICSSIYSVERMVTEDRCWCWSWKNDSTGVYWIPFRDVDSITDLSIYWWEHTWLKIVANVEDGGKIQHGSIEYPFRPCFNNRFIVLDRPIRCVYEKPQELIWDALHGHLFFSHSSNFFFHIYVFHNRMSSVRRGRFPGSRKSTTLTEFLSFLHATSLSSDNTRQ